jgi:hypothetical protein
MGSALFSSRQILLNAFVEAVVGDMSAPQFGFLLGRAEADHVNVEGLVVMRHLKRDHNNSLWQIVRLS